MLHRLKRRCRARAITPGSSSSRCCWRGWRSRCRRRSSPPPCPRSSASTARTPPSAAWILTGYLLAASVATPIVGKLGDLFGRGRVLTIVLLVFAAGSAVCALAPSLGVLVAGRIIQGVGGGIFPLAFGIIREAFPPERVATAIGGISATFGIGGGVGLVIAGLIVEALDASWLFWLGLMALPAAFAIWRYVPQRGDARPTRRSTGWAPRCSRSRWRACCSGSARPTPGAGAHRACSAFIARRARPGGVLGLDRDEGRPAAGRHARAAPPPGADDQHHRGPGRLLDVRVVPADPAARADARALRLRLRRDGHRRRPADAAEHADHARRRAVGRPAGDARSRRGCRW